MMAVDEVRERKSDREKGGRFDVKRRVCGRGRNTTGTGNDLHAISNLGEGCATGDIIHGIEDGEITGDFLCKP